MSRITENWDRVMQSVGCPICGAVRGAPCINPYGMVFEGKGHSDRRSKYYSIKSQYLASVEVSPCDAEE